jgi:hypothetical protein
MKEYEKDYNYVKMQIDQSIIIQQINAAKQVLRHFEDKWMTRLSVTDPSLNKDRKTLHDLYEKKFTAVSKSYLP